MIFVDTNYFLRFLLKDNQIQHKTAKNLFRPVLNDKTRLITSIVVMFEINWVLNSYYEFNKTDVLSAFRKVLKLNFKLEEKNLLTKALDLYNQTNLSLEDCYNLIFVQKSKIAEFKTFDKKLLKQFVKLDRG